MLTAEAKNIAPPRHVAIIMDGNGRWAEERQQSRLTGHWAGADSAREIIAVAREIGVKVLTLYAFSTENWARPKQEVSGLMTLLKHYISSEINTMFRNNIRLHCIGQPERLPPDVYGVLQHGMDATRACDGMTLNLALSYGAHDELVRAVRQLARDCGEGRLCCDEISEADVAARLDTAGQPDPDLLIRTGGECRLSNFLLWQMSYAELYFTEIKWPDFKREQFIQAIQLFNRRQRRFGQTGAQLCTE